MKMTVNELLVKKLNELTTRIEQKTVKINQLAAKLKELDNWLPLQELVKKKAYLESSVSYFNEKYGNIQKYAADKEDDLTKLEKENETLKESLEKKSAEIEGLKQKLKKAGER